MGCAHTTDYEVEVLRECSICLHEEYIFATVCSGRLFWKCVKCNYEHREG